MCVHVCVRVCVRVCVCVCIYGCFAWACVRVPNAFCTEMRCSFQLCVLRECMCAKAPCPGSSLRAIVSTFPPLSSIPISKPLHEGDRGPESDRGVIINED